ASGGKALSQLDAAGAARRHDVRDQGVDRKGRAVPFLEGGRGGFEFRHLVALLLERFADEASKRRLVFHEDDAAPMRRAWPRDSAVPPLRDDRTCAAVGGREVNVERGPRA